jgi:hypothetical protein
MPHTQTPQLWPPVCSDFTVHALGNHETSAATRANLGGSRVIDLHPSTLTLGDKTASEWTDRQDRSQVSTSAKAVDRSQQLSSLPECHASTVQGVRDGVAR